MNNKRKYLLFMVSGGMEFCWLYAWATFLMTSLLHQPFPFKEAISAFVFAWALTLLSKGRGWRIVHILGLQVFGFISAALSIIYVFYSFPHPFFGQTWLAEFYNSLKSPLEWLILILLLFWALLFWVGGLTLARRPMAYPALCTRFDWGLSAIFVLFLIKFLVLVKGETEIDDPLSYLLLFPFFVLSLLSIGLARGQSAAPKDFLPGYQGIGVILSFTFTVFLWGTGLVLFFLPYLTLASKVGAGLLKTAAIPFGLVFVSILRFLFFRSASRVDAPLSTNKGGLGDIASPVQGGWWSDLLEKVLGWGLWGLSGLAVLTLSGLAVYFLFSWLFSRTSVSPGRQGPWDLISSWAETLKAFLFSCWNRLVRGKRGDRRASHLYGALLRWGRRSGLSHYQSETPAEYGLRLKHQFPVLEREIDWIIETFHQEVYGEKMLVQEQWVAVQLAWRKLCGPLHWPSRLKTRFLRPVEQRYGSRHPV
jgi:hypothetical protein